MAKKTDIQPIQSDFEQIRKTDENGQEYWNARELAPALGYSTWQKFNRVLNKALQVAQNRGMEINEHFNQTVEMVKLGSGSFRNVENWHLSHMACLIVAENADSKKPQVQNARLYFREHTPTSELIENQMTSRILIYKTNQGETRIEVLFNGQTFWLTQKKMADLYNVEVSTINYHLGQIYESGELKEEATIRKFEIVQTEGGREVNRSQMIYNLDLAENRADRHLITTMAEWKQQLERFMATYNYEVLEGGGSVSTEEAKDKAYGEYDKFRLIQDREYLSDFDKEIKNWKELGLFDNDN